MHKIDPGFRSDYPEQVYQVLEQCTCPVRYPVFRVGEGKYRVGEAKSLIFVRVRKS